MKVTQVSTWDVPCGIADYTGELCRALDAIDAGIETDVVAIDRDVLSYLSRRELRSHFEALTAGFAGADVVHIQHEFVFFAGSYFYRESIANFRHVLKAALRGGRPTVVTFHTIPFFVDWTRASLNRDTARQLLYSAARTWWRASVATVFNGAPGACALVHGLTARRLLIDSGLGRERIEVIPHATPPPRELATPATRAAVRERLGLRRDGTVIGIFGFLAPSKGHLDAVEALRLLPPDHQLLIAGGPHPNDNRSALGEILARIAAHPELADRVTITGYLETADAQACLDAVDLMIAPYRDPQQMASGALGWALASGKPVIATRIPAFRELAETSGAAYLVPSESPAELALAIERVTGDLTLSGELVAAAGEWCTANSWEHVARRHDALYKRLAAGLRAAQPQTPHSARAPSVRQEAAATLPLIAPNARIWSRSEDRRPLLASAAVAPAVLRTVEFRAGSRVSVAVDPHATDDPLVRDLLAHRYPGDLPAQLVLHLLSGEPRTFVDIGAHVGTFSLPAAALGARVVALDGSAANARLLRTAVTYNDFKNITVVHGAAAAKRGKLNFHEAGLWGYVTSGFAQQIEGRGVSVEAYSVDELLDSLDIEHVDLLKIDIEGYEIEALKGMRKLLSGKRAPAVLFECNASMLEAFGSGAPELKEAFEAYGYALHYLDRSRPGHLIAARAADIQPEAAADYLALKEIPATLAPWQIDPPMEHDDLVSRLCVEGRSREPLLRAYALRTIFTGGAALRGDPLIEDLLAELAGDAAPAVQEAFQRAAEDSPAAAAVSPGKHAMNGAGAGGDEYRVAQP